MGMTASKKQLLVMAFQMKLERGELLENILNASTKLTVAEKDELRIALSKASTK